MDKQTRPLCPKCGGHKLVLKPFSHYVDGVRVLCWSTSPICSYAKELIPYRDGNKWCVLWGANLAEGVCGFADTPRDAIDAFSNAFYSTTSTPPAGQVGAVASDLLRLAHNADNHTIASLKQHLFVIHKELEQSILKASGAEHIAGLVGALESIAADPYEVGGYAAKVANEALSALPPELRGK